jgi:hypothetical protein
VQADEPIAEGQSRQSGAHDEAGALRERADVAGVAQRAADRHVGARVAVEARGVAARQLDVASQHRRELREVVLGARDMPRIPCCGRLRELGQRARRASIAGMPDA